KGGDGSVGQRRERRFVKAAKVLVPIDLAQVLKRVAVVQGLINLNLVGLAGDNGTQCYKRDAIGAHEQPWIVQITAVFMNFRDLLPGAHGIEAALYAEKRRAGRDHVSSEPASVCK